MLPTMSCKVIVDCYRNVFLPVAVTKAFLWQQYHSYNASKNTDSSWSIYGQGSKALVVVKVIKEGMKMGSFYGKIWK